MELLIGRDSDTSKLAILIEGQKRLTYGEAGSVPKSVSRQHCKINIDNETYRISSANISNVTMVNGMRIEQKNINPQKDTIVLGGGGYELDLPEIIRLLRKNSSLPPQSFSISHLERIWNHNHDTKLQLQIKEKKTAAIRSATGLITTVSIVCACMPSLATLRIPLVIVGIVLGLYFAITMYRSSSNMPLFLDKLDKDFRKKYVCPNPECGKFLGYHQPFEELARTSSCPYCKSKFKLK